MLETSLSVIYLACSVKLDDFAQFKLEELTQSIEISVLLVQNLSSTAAPYYIIHRFSKYMYFPCIFFRLKETFPFLLYNLIFFSYSDSKTV